MYELPRSCQQLSRKTNKSEWKQTKTDANCALITVPIMPQLFGLSTKLSRSELQYFVLSYIQYSKNDSVAGSVNNSEVLVNKIVVLLIIDSFS